MGRTMLLALKQSWVPRAEQIRHRLVVLTADAWCSGVHGWRLPENQGGSLKEVALGWVLRMGRSEQRRHLSIPAPSMLSPETPPSAHGWKGPQASPSLLESFTPDHKPLMGEAPELRGFFLGCGFNSAGE